MLAILAHRGFWQKPEEKNSPAALRRALAEGFGIETDLRDHAGRLVISHDPAGPDSFSAPDFLALCREINPLAPLALNIKADGLRPLLKSLLQHHPAQNYFCFDMSVPETLLYHRDGLRFFTRESEHEPAPVLYAPAAGVWLDMFTGDWATPAHLSQHLQAGKQVALVSPELHGRPHLPFWTSLRASPAARDPSLMLCTDHPQAAREFFHD